MVVIWNERDQMLSKEKEIVLFNMRIADLRVDADHWWSNEIEVFELTNNVMLIGFLLILNKVCS